MEDRYRGFSVLHGENVALSGDHRKANWNHVYSGGILFSDRPISETTSGICVHLSGSGHVHVGLIEKDPATLRNVRSAYENGDIKTVNVIKFHKRPCSVDIKLQRNVFILTHEHENFRYKTSGNCVWIAIYIKLGDAEIKLESDDGLCFHSKSGENIKRLQIPTGAYNTAKLRDENPHATCLLPIIPGKSLRLEFYIEPISEDSRGPPRRYHAKFGISSANFMERSNSLTGVIDHDGCYRILHTFEQAHKKDGCRGTLTVTIQERKTLSYAHDGDKDATNTVSIEEYRELYLVFELYRVSIAIRDPENYLRLQMVGNIDRDVAAGGDNTRFRRAEEHEEESYDEIIAITDYIKNVDDYAKIHKDDPLALSEILQKTESLCETFEREGRSILQRDKENNTLTEYRTDQVYSTWSMNINRLKTDVEFITKRFKERQSSESCSSIQMQKVLETQHKIYEKLTKIEKKFDSVYMTRRQTLSSDDIKKSMQKHQVKLINNLVPFPFCDHLFQDDTINQNEYEELVTLKERSATDHVNRNLLIVLRKRNLDITKLYKALVNTRQEHIYSWFCDKD